ncbi:MAG: hypothetical protein HC927_12655 [Deltaproteobacteria bacterium]|nr:hypothetical protein [Deltaproteobacteria bacterium]
MNEIISALKRDKGRVRELEYSKIISAFKDLGYTGSPERWRKKVMPVKFVLPDKIEWFVKQNADVEPRQIREALGRGGVRV